VLYKGMGVADMLHGAHLQKEETKLQSSCKVRSSSEVVSRKGAVVSCDAGVGF